MLRSECKSNSCLLENNMVRYHSFSKCMSCRIIEDNQPCRIKLHKKTGKRSKRNYSIVEKITKFTVKRSNIFVGLQLNISKVREGYLITVSCVQLYRYIFVLNYIYVHIYIQCNIPYVWFIYKIIDIFIYKTIAIYMHIYIYKPITSNLYYCQPVFHCICVDHYYSQVYFFSGQTAYLKN